MYARIVIEVSQRPNYSECDLDSYPVRGFGGSSHAVRCPKFVEFLGGGICLCLRSFHPRKVGGEEHLGQLIAHKDAGYWSTQKLAKVLVLEGDREATDGGDVLAGTSDRKTWVERGQTHLLR